MTHPPASSRASAPTTDLDELRAFARLYGYVRFFHPSDEAAALDWDAFATHGAMRVIQGSNHEELEAALAELFLPVAPTLDVYADDVPPRDAAALFPKRTRGLKQVAWQHLGFGLGERTTVYLSKRLHRRRLAPIGHSAALVVQVIEASSMRGHAARLRGWARVDPSCPWMKC
ncbi:MAG: hypothetical protein KC636_22380, partial [Myxococcales bacterium]|nr:hypothetical protein [Myxococcales bacterium]